MFSHFVTLGKCDYSVWALAVLFPNHTHSGFPSLEPLEHRFKLPLGEVHVSIVPNSLDLEGSVLEGSFLLLPRSLWGLRADEPACDVLGVLVPLPWVA